MIKRLPEFFLKCAKPNAISYWTYQPRYNFAENNENENKPKLPPIDSQKEPLKFNGIRIIALLVGTSWILILGIYMNAEKFLMAARNNEPLPVRDNSTSQAALPEEYRSEYIEKVKRKMRLKAKKDKSQEITIVTKGDDGEID